MQLSKSYCLPFILYTTEAIPLTKSYIKIKDDCIKYAIAKIFKVRDDDKFDNIDVIRHIWETIERRRLKLVNNVMDIPYLTCLFPLWF